MEASVVLPASLTVNVCVLSVLFVSWILRKRGGSRGHDREGLEDGYEENDTHELRKPTTHNVNRTSTEESMDAYVLSDIVMSTLCVGAGIYIIASSSLLQCPFTCPAVNPSGSPAVPSSDLQHVKKTSFGPVPVALLSAAFGRFLFSFFQLLHVGCRSGQWTLWSAVHSGYLCINVIVVGVVLITGENLLGGTLVLLMEADVAIEEICQVVDRRAADKQLRKARVLLSVLGCVMSFGTRVAMPWIMCFLLGHVYNPIGMTVNSLAVASFGFIFYQACTLLAMKQQCERIQRVLGDVDRETANDAIEPYHSKSRCSSNRGPGSKDVAFHLINEGLIEISSYAKTVAGAITGKKLVAMKTLCDNFMPVKPESKSIAHNITSI